MVLLKYNTELNHLNFFHMLYRKHLDSLRAQTPKLEIIKKISEPAKP